MDNQKNKVKLNRTMTPGQMEMIAIGGTIGSGLFMGATSTIKWTGPSVLLAYAFVGLVLYGVMRALGEMIYISPGTGSFADYGSLSWISDKVEQRLSVYHCWYLRYYCHESIP